MSLLFSFLCALYLSLNLNSGSILELSDGSRWQISPDDAQQSSLWLVPMEIEISRSKDTNYPYVLSNLQTKQAVKAKKIN